MKRLPADTPPDPNDVRAAVVRIATNALLVLVAFELVSIVGGVGLTLVRGETMPVPLAQLVLLMAVFLLVRWIFVLPAMLPVLVGLEYVSRRVPHARVLTGIVAFAPMILWELTNGPGGPSSQGAMLGVTAVLFALVARLPPRSPRRSTEQRGTSQLPAEPAVPPG